MIESQISMIQCMIYMISQFRTVVKLAKIDMSYLLKKALLC